MFAITFIAHGEQLADQDIQDIETSVLPKLDVGSFEKKSLSPRAVDYYVNVSDPPKVSQQLKQEQGKHAYDIIFQDNDQRKNKKLFIFDMDLTLIYQEVIELIAAYADIEDKVAEITTRAMNGELDFNELLRERVALLKGIDATNLWEELKEKIELTRGVKQLTTALNKLGIVTGVLSGGFIPLAQHVKEVLGLKYAYANTLGVDDENKLDGTTKGMIVNGDKKAELLLQIAEENGIDPKQAVAVGDGANDLPMMGKAGFGIAWNAKPKVQQAAPCCLNTKSLQDVLYILGYDDAEISSLTV